MPTQQWTPAGARRRHITIQQQSTATKTAMGFLKNSWADVLSTSAKVTVRPVTNAAAVGPSQEPITRNSYILNIRYAPSITILPGMRVKDDTAYYLIQSVADVEERHRELNLFCTQIPAPAAEEQ